MSCFRFSSAHGLFSRSLLTGLRWRDGAGRIQAGAGDVRTRSDGGVTRSMLRVRWGSEDPTAQHGASVAPALNSTSSCSGPRGRTASLAGRAPGSVRTMEPWEPLEVTGEGAPEPRGAAVGVSVSEAPGDNMMYSSRRKPVLFFREERRWVLCLWFSVCGSLSVLQRGEEVGSLFVVLYLWFCTRGSVPVVLRFSTRGSVPEVLYPWFCTRGSEVLYPWFCTWGSVPVVLYLWFCTCGSVPEVLYLRFCTWGSLPVVLYLRFCTRGSVPVVLRFSDSATSVQRFILTKILKFHLICEVIRILFHMFKATWVCLQMSWCSFRSEVDHVGSVLQVPVGSMHRLQAVRPLHGAGAGVSAVAAAQLFRGHVPPDARRQTPQPAAAAGAALSRGQSGVCSGRPVLGSSQAGPDHPLQGALRGAAGVRSLHAHVPQQEEDPPQVHYHQPGGSLQVSRTTTSSRWRFIFTSETPVNTCHVFRYTCHTWPTQWDGDVCRG